VNEGWPAYEAALGRQGGHTAHFFEGANHGFDTTPRRRGRRELAWQRTLTS
jgi:hypothetical protein